MKHHTPLAADGRYFQGMPEPPTMPADGSTEPTNPNLKPSDRSKTWAQWSISLNANPKIQSSITEYDGPSGKGWTINQAVSIAGQVWRRICLGEGPETNREIDWYEEPVS